MEDMVFKRIGFIKLGFYKIFQQTQRGLTEQREEGGD